MASKMHSETEKHVKITYPLPTAFAKCTNKEARNYIKKGPAKNKWRIPPHIQWQVDEKGVAGRCFTSVLFGVPIMNDWSIAWNVLQRSDTCYTSFQWVIQEIQTCFDNLKFLHSAFLSEQWYARFCTKNQSADSHKIHCIVERGYHQIIIEYFWLVVTVFMFLQ